MVEQTSIWGLAEAYYNEDLAEVEWASFIQLLCFSSIIPFIV